MIGKTVGKYRIVDRLGRGGMGTVYKAIDETLDRDVAIKVLNPDLGDPEVLKRFRAEAVALAKLNHPGIATIYELYRQDDDLLMVMEFVRGETLQALSERLGALAPPQAAHICLQILDALGHAHRAGVVHRDLKPANVMVTESGVVKVMDFGIARVLGTEHFTHAGYMMGTPAYMAPEQVLGTEIDGRADLYSVGVVFYRLLSRELPFTAETAIAMVQKQVGDLPTPIGNFRPDLPDWCGLVIDRALAKRPDDRYQSAEEFRAVLQSAVRAEPLGDLPTMLTPPPPGLRIGQDLSRGYSGQTSRPAPAPPPDPDETRLVTSSTAVAATRQTGLTAQTGQTVQTGQTATPPAERTSATVVLGRNSLVTLVALLVILALGVAVLAFVALRRPDAVQAQLQPDAASADALPDGQDAGEAQEPTAGSPVPEGDADGVPEVPPTDAAPQGQKPARPPVVAAADAGHADGRAKAAGGAAANGNGVPAIASRDEDPEPPPAPEPPAAPALAPVTVRGVRVLLTDGDTLREREVVLQLEGQQLSLLDGPDGPSVISLPYAQIASAFYSRGNHPRWRDDDGDETTARVDRGRLGFLRAERNWLVLTKHAGEPLIIRLEDNVLRTAIGDFQDRSGVIVKR